MVPKFFHYCQDEKFIGSAYQQFELLYPNQNHFFIYDCPSHTTNHIQLNENFSFITLKAEAFTELPNNAIVIFHSLPDHIIPFLHYLPTEAKVIWLLFGFETYEDESLYDKKTLLDKYTYGIFGKRKVKDVVKEKIKSVLYDTIGLFNNKKYTIDHKKRLIAHRIKKLNQLKRIDYFGCGFEEEYLNQMSLLGFERPFFDFGYYPLEQILTINAPVELKKDSILIGHSAFSNGNHLDVVKRIKSFPNIDNQPVVMPFSYGNQKYKNRIQPRLKKDLKQINFLENFVSLIAYTSQLSTVRVAILNNRRQQALGNIITLLYMGAAVYLSNKNSYYHFLKRNQVRVFCYESDLNSENYNVGLNADEINNNRQILKAIYCENVVNAQFSKSLNNVLKDIN